MLIKCWLDVDQVCIYIQDTAVMMMMIQPIESLTTINHHNVIQKWEDSVVDIVAESMNPCARLLVLKVNIC